jgi:hypothetical protein
MILSLVGDRLTLQWEWYEQLWAFNFNQTFDIPLTHIEAVTIDEPLSSWQEIRAPGSFLPGVIKAGTYYTNRGKEFWYVTSDRNYLVLALHDESYQRIILTLEGNESWQERIHEALNLVNS